MVLRKGVASARWAVPSENNSQSLSVAIPALEGGKDQIAH